MDDSLALGTLIRTSRLGKGLSLGQLASAVGRSSSSVRRWERGEVAPAETVVSELAEALDLDEDTLRAMIQSVHAPAQPEPYAGTEEDEIPATHTTIEDDVAIVEDVTYFETPSPTSVPPPQQPAGWVGRFSAAIFGSRESWIGWVRGILTALALLFLFMGLVWAVGELLVALQDVLDSFSTGTSGS